MSDPRSGEDGRSWRDRVADLFTGEPTSRRQLLELLRHSATRELIDLDVLNIIFGAIAMADMRARDIMIPRSQLVFVRADAKLEAFLPTVIGSQHSRSSATTSMTYAASCTPKTCCRCS